MFCKIALQGQDADFHGLFIQVYKYTRRQEDKYTHVHLSTYLRVYTKLPTTSRHFLTLSHLRNISSNHGLAEILAHLCKNGGVLIMCYRFYNGRGTPSRVARFENSGANEDTVHTQLHHQSRVSGSRNSARCKIHNRHSPMSLHLLYQFIRRAVVLGKSH